MVTRKLLEIIRPLFKNKAELKKNLKETCINFLTYNTKTI